jgi:hypothetical protein
LYIPLGGSRNGKFKAVRNTFIIFLVSGFWHGASWNFIAWGFIHACGFLPLLLLNRNRRYTTDIVAQGKTLPSIKELIQMLSTFAFVTVAWVFFRAETIGDAVGFLNRIVLNIVSNPLQLLHKPLINTPKLQDNVSIWASIKIIVLISMDFSFRHDERVIFKHIKYKYFIYNIMLLLIMLSWSKSETFIYFSF